MMETNGVPAGAFDVAVPHLQARHELDNLAALSRVFAPHAPYRAKLFKLVRTTYWIIYVVDDERQVVEILRLWNSARELGTRGL